MLACLVEPWSCRKLHLLASISFKFFGNEHFLLALFAVVTCFLLCFRLQMLSHLEEDYVDGLTKQTKDFGYLFAQFRFTAKMLYFTLEFVDDVISISSLQLM